MKLQFTLHGVPDQDKNSSDLFRPGKLPTIRIKEHDHVGKNYEQMEGILWFAPADSRSLNIEAGWRYYNLKKL